MLIADDKYIFAKDIYWAFADDFCLFNVL